MNQTFNRLIKIVILVQLLLLPQIVLATTGLGALAGLQTLFIFMFVAFVWFWIIFLILDTDKRDRDRKVLFNNETQDKRQQHLLETLMIIQFLLAIVFVLIGLIELKPSYLLQFKYLYFSFAFILVFSGIFFKIRSNTWAIYFTVPVFLVFIIWTIVIQINASHSVSHYYSFLYSNLTIANISIIFYSLFMSLFLLKIQKDYFK